MTNEIIKDFIEKMLYFFPSASEEYYASIIEYGEVMETIVIEDIFMPKILMLLTNNDNTKLLKDVFIYLEEVVNRDEPYLINIISITILEILGNNKAILNTAKQYMGSKTAVLQKKADMALGRL